METGRLFALDVTHGGLLRLISQLRRHLVHIEVDQSGKIEKMNVDTVLAFSDGK